MADAARRVGERAECQLGIGNHAELSLVVAADLRFVRVDVDRRVGGIENVKRDPTSWNSLGESRTDSGDQIGGPALFVRIGVPQNRFVREEGVILSAGQPLP